MRKYALIAVLVALAGCTTSSTVEPIPGSITYGGQPRTKLEKSPIGSTFKHDFRMDDGRRAVETYQIAPNRSLILLRRVIISDVPAPQDN